MSKKSKAQKLTLGEKLKFYRTRQGLTQLELALECDVNAGTIADIERNKSGVSIDLLHKIGTALNLTSQELSYLFNVNLYKQKEDNSKPGK